MALLVSTLTEANFGCNTTNYTVTMVPLASKPTAPKNGSEMDNDTEKMAPLLFTLMAPESGIKTACLIE